MRHKINLVFCLLVILSAGLGCRMLGGLGKANYFEGDAAKTSAEKVSLEIGKPFNVFEVMIENNEFRLQAQDPDNPKNLDEYKVIGGFVTGPNPIKTNAMQKDLEKSTFPFDQINFAAVPDFTREALEKSKIEGAKIRRITFQRGFAIKENDAGALGNGRWHIEIEGTRESASATASPNGKLLGVDLSRTTQAADYKVITPEELQKAHDALRNHLGANTKISKIVIYEKNLGCSIANPQNPSVEDSYQYGINGLTKGGLVQMPKINTSFEQDFVLGDINLPDAANYLEKAKQRVEMPDAVLTSMSIRRTTKSVLNKEFRTVWSVSLKKGVNEASVDYDTEGKEIRVRKNGKTIFEEDIFKNK